MQIDKTNKLDENLFNKDDNYKEDNRIKDSKIRNFDVESYNIFKLEISNYLNNNKKEKELFIENNKHKNINEKILKYKKYLYNITNNLYININRNNEIDNYKLNNYRILCEYYKKNKICNKNIFCLYDNGRCRPTLKKSLIYNHITRLSNEIAYNELYYKELLNIENYFINNIINTDLFKLSDKHYLIKSSNIVDIKKIYEQFFKEDIGNLKKYKQISNIDIGNVELIKYDNLYIQEVYNKNMIYRAYINLYYYIKNNYDIEKNLGYYSNTQTELINYFKGLTINWLLNISNKEIYNNNIYKYNKIEYKNINNVIYGIVDKNIVENNTNIQVILLILYYIIKIPIVIYNDNIEIIFIVDKNIIKENYDIKYNNNYKYINLQINYSNNKIISIKSLYIVK